MTGPEPIYVTQLGAKGDGQALDSPAIQKALDQAAEHGGGAVVLSPGRYRCGTLVVRSNVALEIQAGATLVASHDLADFPQRDSGQQQDYGGRHLILMDRADNVTLRGAGTIDGQDQAFWQPSPGPNKWIDKKETRVHPLIQCFSCSDLRLLDVTIINSPGWTVHLHQCDRVFVRGLRISNNMFGPNTDGLAINGCRDVFVTDTRIDTGEDAIALKTTQDSRSCERISVTNCVLRSNCAAFKLGTRSFHDMRQIVLSNSVLADSNRGVALHCFDGATFEDISISNIICDTGSPVPMPRPIHLDLRRREPSSRMGHIRNVKVTTFNALTTGRILMTAEDDGYIQNVSLRDLHLSYPSIDNIPELKKTFSDPLQFSNNSPEARWAPAAIVADNVTDLQLTALTITWPTEPPAWDWQVLWGRNLRRGLIDCPSVTPLRWSGEKFVLHRGNIRIRE